VTLIQGGFSHTGWYLYRWR